MITLFSMPSSGNSYKVRLLLAKLDLPFRHVAIEHGSPVTASAEFRAKSPMGRLPVLELEDGRAISESNAILLFLGEGTRFVPEGRYERAKVHQWMFFEQNYHETSVATRTAVLTYEDRAHRRTADILGPLLESGNRALGAMEAQLERSPFLAGEAISVADLCLYGYTHSAGDKGGFDMARFPAVNDWLARVAADRRHVPLEWLPQA
jgi:glutathione S-transferase